MSCGISSSVENCAQIWHTAGCRCEGGFQYGKAPRHLGGSWMRSTRVYIWSFQIVAFSTETLLVVTKPVLCLTLSRGGRAGSDFGQ